MDELFDGARAHDPVAVGALDRIVREMARSVCRGGGPAGAPDLDWEDVAQEAYRRLHEVGFDSYRGRGSERSYVYSVVKATVIQMVRTARRRRRREDAAAAVSSDATVDVSAGMSVRSILEALDEGCRDVLVRVLLRDQTYSEAALDLGLAESSVRAKLSRCLRRARELAGRRGPR